MMRWFEGLIMLRGSCDMLIYCKNYIGLLENVNLDEKARIMQRILEMHSTTRNID